ncbi:hypothetical protein PHYSODRAFT_321312, partial [Plasmopara halstedii]
MKEIGSLPRSPTLTTAPSPDVTADMELMGATNRDMFSWLLYNSENMTASAGAGSHLSVDHSNALTTSLVLDDPFRLLGSGDDTSLSLALQPSSTSTPLLQSEALTLALPV